MMIQGMSSPFQGLHLASSAAAGAASAPQTDSQQTQAGSTGDSGAFVVHLSAEGKAMSAGQSAAEESTETQAQTEQEAMNGDVQAQQKLNGEQTDQGGGVQV